MSATSHVSTLRSAASRPEKSHDGSEVISLPRATDTHPVWLHVGTLLDGTSTTPLRDAHIVYNRTEITFVGCDGERPSPQFCRVGQSEPDIDLPNATLLPGLIEAHAHLFLEGGELDVEKRAAYLRQTPEELLAGGRSRLEKLVRLGVAGVRDAGDKDGVGLALSRLYRAHDHPVMPYVESPGAAIHRRGRYGSFMADALENYPSARACVEARIAAGADRIKLIPTGIINFKKAQVISEPQMTVEDVSEIVSAAKSLGWQTFAHASGDVGIDRVIDGGVDSIEHGFFVRDDQLARMRDRQIAWVPTFAPVQAQVDHADRMGWTPDIAANLRGILEQHAASLAKAHALGVTIVAGSDAGSYGVPHGVGLLRELELMERAGLPSIAVVNAATGVGAQRFAYHEGLGKIAAGYRARFMVTNHSPLATVANLRKPRTVVFDGEMFPVGAEADVAGL